jgi:hypothetical protein
VPSRLFSFKHLTFSNSSFRFTEILKGGMYPCHTLGLLTFNTLHPSGTLGYELS